MTSKQTQVLRTEEALSVYDTLKPSRIAFEHHWVKTRGKRARNDLQRHPAQPETYISDAANRHWVTWQAAQPKEPEQSTPCGEPVELSVDGAKINNIQVQSIKRVIARAKHAHMTDIKLRINGQDEWYEADWIKHITQTTELKCDGDFPEGFDSSFGLPAQSLRTANAIMCDAIGTRKWDVPCTAKHLLTFAQLYTTPPYVATPRQRTWVGLTDEDVVSLCREFMGQFDKREFVKATEAKLKEKNT